MNPNNRSELVATYLAYGRYQREEDYWAFDEVETIVESAPERAWVLTLELIHAAESPALVAYIAAGPLEELLARYGETLWPEIKRVALEDTELRRALTAVWGENRIPEHIQRELKALILDVMPQK